jgi:hypothetical protein
MQDLWHIGKAIGLPQFDDTNDEELEEMNKELARAKREDRKEIKSTDEAELQDRMGSYMDGTKEYEQPEAHTQFVSASWIEKIREKYKGSVIRRTVNSLDNTGKAISGLDPYREHRCVVQMQDHEYKALEKLAEKSMDSETFAKRFASEVRLRLSGRERADQVTRDAELLPQHPENAATPVVCRQSGEGEDPHRDI